MVLHASLAGSSRCISSNATGSCVRHWNCFCMYASVGGSRGVSFSSASASTSVNVRWCIVASARCSTSNRAPRQGVHQVVHRDGFEQILAHAELYGLLRVGKIRVCAQEDRNGRESLRLHLAQHFNPSISGMQMSEITTSGGGQQQFASPFAHRPLRPRFHPARRCDGSDGAILLECALHPQRWQFSCVSLPPPRKI